MKLLGKLTNRYISWSLLVMLFMGIVIYFTLSIIINRQMDERLLENLQTIEQQLSQTPETVFFGLDAKVQKTIKAPETIIFSDTLIFNEIEKLDSPDFAGYELSVEKGNQEFEVQVSPEGKIISKKEVDEEED